MVGAVVLAVSAGLLVYFAAAGVVVGDDGDDWRCNN